MGRGRRGVLALLAMAGILALTFGPARTARASAGSWDDRPGPLDGLGGFRDLHDTLRPGPGSSELPTPPLVVGPFEYDGDTPIRLGQYVRLRPYAAGIGGYDDNFQSLDDDIPGGGTISDETLDEVPVSGLAGVRLDVPIRWPEAVAQLNVDYTYEATEYTESGDLDHVDQDGMVALSIDTDRFYFRSYTRFRKLDETGHPEMGPHATHTDLWSSTYFGVDLSPGAGFKVGTGYANSEYERDSLFDRFDHAEYSARGQLWFGLNERGDLRVAAEYRYGHVRYDEPRNTGRNPWGFNQFMAGGYGVIAEGVRFKAMLGWGRNNVHDEGRLGRVDEVEGLVSDTSFVLGLVDWARFELSWRRAFEASVNAPWAVTDRARVEITLGPPDCYELTAGFEAQAVRLPGLDDPEVYQSDVKLTIHLIGQGEDDPFGLDLQVAGERRDRTWDEQNLVVPGLDGDYARHRAWAGLLIAF